MAKLPGIYELMATAASPAINFGRGLLGYQDPFLTQTMQDRMTELEAEKGPTGNVGYEDYGLQTATPGGRFTGGLMGLALNDPVNFGLAGSIGRYSYGPEGRTGLTYDFTPDQDTGSTGSATLDFINRGGLKGALSRMGTAQAAEVTPQNEPLDIEDFLGTSTPRDLGFIGMAPTIKEAVAPIGRPTMADIAGMGDLGNPTGDPRIVSEEMGLVGRPTTSRPTMADVAGEINENLIDRGNPFNDPRVVSEEMGLVGGIPDRGRGMTGPAVEMIGGQAVPVGDVLGRQMALEKADFYEAPKSGLDLGTILSLGGLLTGELPLKAAGLFANRDKIGRMATTARDKVSSGLGSLNRKLRGVNPDGSIRTQSQFEAAREQRRKDKRVANMLERKAAGKSYSQKNLNKLTTGGSKPGTYTVAGSGNAGSPSGGKSIVCTAMYQTTGLQDWKKAMKIWYIYQKKHLTDTHQEGYHWLFKPFVKAMKKSKIVEALGAHVAKHRTQELKHVLFNSKSDKLGKVYNMILEPICFIAGKIKSALGRG